MNKTNELKAKAYDLIAQAEIHQAAIEEIKKQLIKVNQEIREESKKEAKKPKD